MDNTSRGLVTEPRAMFSCLSCCARAATPITHIGSIFRANHKKIRTPLLEKSMVKSWLSCKMRVGLFKTRVYFKNWFVPFSKKFVPYAQLLRNF